MPAGRPTKYKKEFCERIPVLMAEGMSKIEVCAELGFSVETFYVWQEKYKKFSDAIEKGNRLSEAWWERKGRVNLENAKFNTALWFINMKNRHGWSDKKELAVSGLDGLGDRLAKALTKREEYNGVS